MGVAVLRGGLEPRHGMRTQNENHEIAEAHKTGGLVRIVAQARIALLVVGGEHMAVFCLADGRGGAGGRGLRGGGAVAVTVGVGVVGVRDVCGC